MANDKQKNKIALQLKPDKTALVVVDVQNDFCDAKGA
ncbi:MAG: hypothetical protein H6Q55_1763, partial [Deltaproteobacteria bacterium]|nr:hypothetical protein [Deltaproteobacteria bacterium]